MENLMPYEWEKRVNENPNAVILDVRTNDEMRLGSIENAIAIDLMNTDFFLSEIEKLDPTKHYYVYCRSGNRSMNACRIMEDRGFQHTVNMMGGLGQWTGKLVQNL